MANVLGVKPTRMELASLKSTEALATRGHKLLKDKQDELMRNFIDMIRRNNELRDQVEEELTQSLKSFILSKALMNENFMEEIAAITQNRVELDIRMENIMSLVFSGEMGVEEALNELQKSVDAAITADLAK